MPPASTGRLVRALAFDRKVRVLAVVAPGPCAELIERHSLSGTAAVLASEGLLASVLLSGQVKGEERITVEVQGEDPPFAFVADVWGEGPLRARFRPEHLSGPASFRGYISAIRSLDGKERYRGVGAVEGERWEAAMQRFLQGSEGVDGRVRVLAELDEEGKPVFAAGLLVERFPDCEAEAFAALFDEPMKGDFKAMMTAFAFGQLAGGELELLEARDLVFQCTCSAQRVRAMLKALGPIEVREMLEQNGGAEVSCHFCNEVYQVSGAELAELLD
jgi:molecular chaperone Hsp33